MLLSLGRVFIGRSSAFAPRGITDAPTSTTARPALWPPDSRQISGLQHWRGPDSDSGPGAQPDVLHDAERHDVPASRPEGPVDVGPLPAPGSREGLQCSSTLSPRKSGNNQLPLRSTAGGHGYSRKAFPILGQVGAINRSNNDFVFGALCVPDSSANEVTTKLTPICLSLAASNPSRTIIPWKAVIHTLSPTEGTISRPAPSQT